jgi:hypothetical protein
VWGFHVLAKSGGVKGYVLAFRLWGTIFVDDLDAVLFLCCPNLGCQSLGVSSPVVAFVFPFFKSCFRFLEIFG